MLRHVKSVKNWCRVSLKRALKIIFRLSFLEEQEASLNNPPEDYEKSLQEEGRLELLQEQLEQEKLQNYKLPKKH